MERPSQEFGKITIGKRAYAVKRSPPSWNIEILNGLDEHVRNEPLNLLESVRVRMVRGTRPAASARVDEVKTLTRLWLIGRGFEASQDDITAAISNVLPDNARITRVRDVPTGQMVEVVKGTMILMDHESVHGGVIRMRY